MRKNQSLSLKMKDRRNNPPDQSKKLFFETMVVERDGRAQRPAPTTTHTEAAELSAKTCPKHRSSGSGVRRRDKSIWTSRLGSAKLKFSTKHSKRSFLLDRERPVFFSLAREKKMGGSNLDQLLQIAIKCPRREARLPKIWRNYETSNDLYRWSVFREPWSGRMGSHLNVWRT